MSRSKLTSGEVELDLGRYELRRWGHRVKLERKPMELLILLASRRGQLVSRQEISSRLWRSNLFIDTERNLNNIVRKIRSALGDNSATPRFLETVVGKGYRFVGPLRVIDAQYPPLEGSQKQPGRPALQTAREWSERPSLVVLPLVLLGKHAESNDLTLGFADALVARLGNLQGMNVLPTSAVLNLPLEAPFTDIAKRLGVRFAVHGALQISKGQQHLSLELFDQHLQRPLWTRKGELKVDRLTQIVNETAREIAAALHRELGAPPVERPPRYSNDPLAYAEFARGYRLSASGNPEKMELAIQHLTSAVTRDPTFALAHAILSYGCATRHFESDPSSLWLEKAEFHCRRALELEPDLPEGHVAHAFLVWGPSKNFQHLEAIAALKRALVLQKNLPHAYNRLGTILAHVGLLEHAREMYERGRLFHPQRAVSHSIVQVYLWNEQYEEAVDELARWRMESPNNKYAIYFGPQPALMTRDWKTARALLAEGLRLLPDEPLMITLQGLFLALTGKVRQALDLVSRAYASPKTFGHAHHAYYHTGCIFALAGRPKVAFEWLERSVASGFACWPFFLKDPSLRNLRDLPEFELLISSLQAKYPDHLGFL